MTNIVIRDRYFVKGVNHHGQVTSPNNSTKGYATMIEAERVADACACNASNIKNGTTFVIYKAVTHVEPLEVRPTTRTKVPVEDIYD